MKRCVTVVRKQAASRELMSDQKFEPAFSIVVDGLHIYQHRFRLLLFWFDSDFSDHILESDAFLLKVLYGFHQMTFVVVMEYVNFFIW